MIAVIYVDDALLCGPTKNLVDEVKGAFMYKWECRDLGPAKEFLHMRIQKDGSKILIDQCTYLEKVLERFGMTNTRSATTFLSQGYYPLSYNGQVDPDMQSCFHQVIGSLLYIMLGTQPDIAYAVTALFSMQPNPHRSTLIRHYTFVNIYLGHIFIPLYLIVYPGLAESHSPILIGHLILTPVALRQAGLSN